MNNVKPQPQTQAAQTTEPTDFEKLLQKPIKEMTFVPFGGQDKIKLTPKIIQDLIAVKTKSGQTCSERDALKFMMMCQAKRLNPFEGDAYLIGYDTQNGPQFSLITAHQAFLKRAEVHPEYDGMESGVILLKSDDGATEDRQGDFHLPEETIVGGWATVYLKNRTHPIHRRLRMARFNKGFGIWKDDPAGMIVKCAEADGLRSAFPTMVGGLYLREEIDFMPDVPQFSKPIFEVPPTATPRTKAATEAPQPATNEPDDATETAPAATIDSEPATEAPKAEPERSGYNPLKALRLLLKAGGIKEAELLDFWATTGATDGSQASLEDVMVSLPKVIESTAEQFAPVAVKIKELRGDK